MVQGLLLSSSSAYLPRGHAKLHAVRQDETSSKEQGVIEYRVTYVAGYAEQIAIHLDMRGDFEFPEEWELVTHAISPSKTSRQPPTHYFVWRKKGP